MEISLENLLLIVGIIFVIWRVRVNTTKHHNIKERVEEIGAKEFEEMKVSIKMYKLPFFRLGKYKSRVYISNNSLFLFCRNFSSNNSNNYHLVIQIDDKDKKVDPLETGIRYFKHVKLSEGSFTDNLLKINGVSVDGTSFEIKLRYKGNEFYNLINSQLLT